MKKVINFLLRGSRNIVFRLFFFFITWFLVLKFLSYFILSHGFGRALIGSIILYFLLKLLSKKLYKSFTHSNKKETS